MTPRSRFRYKGARKDSSFGSGEFLATEEEFLDWCSRRFHWGWRELIVTSPGGLILARIRMLPSVSGVQYNPRVLEVRAPGGWKEVMRGTSRRSPYEYPAG